MDINSIKLNHNTIDCISIIIKNHVINSEKVSSLDKVIELISNLFNISDDIKK